MRKIILVNLLAALVFSSCARNPNDFAIDVYNRRNPPPPPQPVTVTAFKQFITPSANPANDIVIVVDPATDPTDLGNAQAQMSAFISGLQAASINFHLGFLNASNDTSGNLNTEFQGPTPIIRSTDANPTNEALADLLAISHLTVSTTSQPIATLTQAGSNTQNAGFFRSGAYRTYVVLTNSTELSNDSSITDSLPYISTLDLQTAPANWTVFAMNSMISNSGCFYDQSYQTDLTNLVETNNGAFFQCGYNYTTGMPGDASTFFSTVLSGMANEVEYFSLRDVMPASEFGQYNTTSYTLSVTVNGTPSYDSVVDVLYQTFILEQPATPGSTVDVLLTVQYSPQ